MYIILFLSFITISSFLDFLSEFGYDFKLLESIVGLSALISFINLFYFIANRKIPKAVIVLECLMFVFFIITYIFGYYSTSITSGNLLIEISVIDKIKFLIKVAFYSISMCYNIFIIYKYTDNWSLSVNRATAVARILQTKYKINPKRIIAAGRSQYVPVDDNKTKAGRLNNRRIRIVIMPTVTQVMNLSN